MKRKAASKAQSKEKSRVEIDWVKIEDRYLSTDQPVTEICQEFGVSTSQFYAKRKALNWRSRKALAVEPPQQRGRSASLERGSESDTSALLDRLYSAFNHQIAELENRFDSVPRTDSEDEKTARTLGTLARTLGKLVELQRDADEHSESRGADAADVERLHRELAQRVDRLRRQRDIDKPA